MSQKPPAPGEAPLICAKCQQPLLLGKVNASYLGNDFFISNFEGIVES